MARRLLLARLVIAVALIAARSATAAPGQLDPTFGTGGVVNTPVNFFTYLWDALLYPDDRILVAGATLPFAPGAKRDVLLARYTADGALDPTFGSGGIVVTHIDGPETSTVHIAREADGTIFAAVTLYDNDGEEAYLLRYLPDGTLDATFDGDGVLPLAPTIFVLGIALRPDGRVLIAGGDLSVLRLEQREQDGSFDATFGTGGLMTDSVPQSPGFMALRSDGKILVAGAGGSGTPFFARYEANGSRDLTFGSGGLKLGSGVAYGFKASLDPIDRIVAADDNAPLRALRFDADADPDPTFGGGGASVATNFFTGYVTPRGSLTDADGHVLVWGGVVSGTPFPASGVFARYRPSGELDPSFAGGKVVVPDVHLIAKVLEQSDGKLVAVGAGDPNVVELARYDAVCPPGPDADGDGLPDPCDPCIGPALTHVAFDISNAPAPTGDDRLSIRARIDAPGVPPLDLIASGAQLQIEDASRASVQTVVLPPGDFESATWGNGWQARGRGFRYVQSRTDTQAWFDGLYRFTVTVNGEGELRLRVKAKNGVFPVDPSRLPLRVAVVFTPPYATAGQCGEITFAPGQCLFDVARGRVRCR